MLDPQAQALLDLMAARQVPATHTLSPHEARRLYRERRQFTQTEPQPVAEVRELLALGPRGGVPLRLYRPAGPTEPAPALLYLHGGGWVIGDLDTHDVLCRDIARAAGCVVVSVNYRLAPEHRFPAGLEDGLAALEWLQAEAEALRLDPRRLAVGGDSAGGNLAAAIALTERDALRAAAAQGEAPTRAPLSAQWLVYPATDMRAVAPSHTTNGEGYLLTAETIAWYRQHYMGVPADWSDWRASPLLHPDHGSLPPALVLTAGHDPLRDEGRQYADALSQAGTPAQYLCFERQIHGFITMGRVLDEARTAVALSAAWLRQVWAAGEAPGMLATAGTARGSALMAERAVR